MKNRSFRHQNYISGLANGLINGLADSSMDCGLINGLAKGPANKKNRSDPALLVVI